MTLKTLEFISELLFLLMLGQPGEKILQLLEQGLQYTLRRLFFLQKKCYFQINPELVCALFYSCNMHVVDMAWSKN